VSHTTHTAQIHDGTNTPLNQFIKDPDSLITRVTWKDEQDKVGCVCERRDGRSGA
jgi:septin 7